MPTRGAEFLRGCGSPPQGQGPFLFLRKKKRALTPKKKGAGLRLVCGRTRRPASLRTVLGPLPAVTAVPLRNREKLWFYLWAACICHSRGRVRQCPAWGATTRRAIPLCRGGQWPPGADKVSPCGGRSPSGGKDHFFFCGKRNGPSPQRKRGGRSTVGLGLTTAACGFRITWRTPSGRYGLPLWNKDRPAF